MRCGVIILIVIAAVIAGAAMVVLTGLVGARGIPSETLGRTPNEWRSLLDSLLGFGMFLAYIGTWLGGYAILRNVNPTASTVRCLACGYAKAGLPRGALCPECGGGAENAPLSPPADRGRRFAESFAVWCLGAAVLYIALMVMYPSGPFLAFFHCLMTTPAMAIVTFDRRFTDGQSRFITAVVMAGAVLGTAWGMYDSVHSRDAQAAIGIVGAFFAGWMFAGPSYLLAAIAVRVAVKRAARD